MEFKQFDSMSCEDIEKFITKVNNYVQVRKKKEQSRKEIESEIEEAQKNYDQFCSIIECHKQRINEYEQIYQEKVKRYDLLSKSHTYYWPQWALDEEAEIMAREKNAEIIYEQKLREINEKRNSLVIEIDKHIERQKELQMMYNDNEAIMQKSKNPSELQDCMNNRSLYRKLISEVYAKIEKMRRDNHDICYKLEENRNEEYRETNIGLQNSSIRLNQHHDVQEAYKKLMREIDECERDRYDISMKMHHERQTLASSEEYLQGYHEKLHYLRDKLASI